MSPSGNLGESMPLFAVKREGFHVIGNKGYQRTPVRGLEKTKTEAGREREVCWYRVLLHECGTVRRALDNAAASRWPWEDSQGSLI